ncbi:MAG: SGNH/GDSL hydrolase family protein [Chloroflexi bacterium]|nr:SGNH/GDSL hydrolase family protein [Chloroflexota bacterium]
MNEVVRAEALAVGALVANPCDAMADNAGAWTSMLTDFDIHPNADGYQVLANSPVVARGG